MALCGREPEMTSNVKDWSRIIVVVRHARAVSFAESDHERALTPTGASDAGEAGAWLGAWLAERGLRPEHMLVSSARRTCETWVRMAEGAGWGEAEAVIEDGLYSAGPEAALEYLRSAPAAAEVVLYVGHNPTVSYLVSLLEDGGADPGLFEGISGGLPTAAVTILGTEQPWAELEEGRARLLDFHVGRAES